MRYTLLFFLSLTLAACGANIDVRTPIPEGLISGSDTGGYRSINVRADETEASSHFIRSLSDNLRQHLTELELYPKKEGTLKVRIQVIGYEINGGTAREVMGVLAGADKVRSRVQVIDTTTNRVVGESIVFTSSAMAYGQQAMAWVHADDIIRFLSN